MLVAVRWTSPFRASVLGLYVRCADTAKSYQGILSIFALWMGAVSAHTLEPWNEIAANLNAMTYLKRFARGLFDSRGLVFFLALTGGFLFLSVKMLESRRWR